MIHLKDYSHRGNRFCWAVSSIMSIIYIYGFEDLWKCGAKRREKSTMMLCWGLKLNLLFLYLESCQNAFSKHLYQKKYQQRNFLKFYFKINIEVDFYLSRMMYLDIKLVRFWSNLRSLRFLNSALQQAH